MKNKTTKKRIVLAFFLLWGAGGFNAQVKKLNDPSIVAQHKRMVFEGWGDWRPYPNYVLGVQTNFAYATVWGWLSPEKNQDYKNGPDIRPLKPTGLEVQRLAELELEGNEAQEIKLQVDSLYSRNIQDFAHWTSLTVDADPLWLLYYKTMLAPLHNFPDHPQNYIEWGLDKPETYQKLLENGGIDIMQEKLDLLKDQYKNSRTHDMPRGKRFLMYHETLMGWRDFLKLFRGYRQKTALFFDFKKKLANFNHVQLGDRRYIDVQIAQQIIAKYKNQF
jgi:hypothetical protein